MKKLVFAAMTIMLTLVACNEASKKVNVQGDWKFKEHVEGTSELNPQNKAMINSIVGLFKDGTISLQDGKVAMESPKAGSREGTYTVEDGKLNVSFGGNNQFILHVQNEADNLNILFGEVNTKELGKVVLVKQ